ncbi:hypothetical protein B2J93_6960 [Marssonina coronariae]|uniref:Ribonucleases P/MRP subunit Pop8-like domain-containing protein n=1 Tax=Diplocarpon coronariae TaxID=2795749 RepID=A0A218YY63_9HELO|nr:hypothetical protein B2J93_6960 [Marssonina coronariae]
MDVGNFASTAETKKKQGGLLRGHDIATKTIKAPRFSYAQLELISEQPTLIDPPLDSLTVRSYIGSALARFLGLTGTAVPVDILRVEGVGCWIRVPREDMSPVLAALGGWSGGSEVDGKVGWKVKTSGNWLSLLVAHGEGGHVWYDGGSKA